MNALAASFLVLVAVGQSPLPWGLQWADALVPVLLGLLLLHPQALRVRTLNRFVALYLISSVVAAITSVDPRASLLGVAKDAYLAVVYVVMAEVEVRCPEGWIAKWLAVGALATSVAGLAGVLGSAVGATPLDRLGIRMAVPVVGTLFRPSGLLYSPEMLGDLLTCTLPLMAWLAYERDRRWWFAAGAAAITAMLTASHALGGVLTAALVFVWPIPAWRRARWLAAAGVVAFVVALNVVSIVAIRQLSLESGRERVEAPPFEHAPPDPDGTAPSVDVRIAYSPVSYFLLKRVAWSTFTEHPWVGTGPGTFQAHTERAVGERTLPPTYRQADPHSTWLGRAAETGITGTLALALLWTAVLRRSAGSSGQDAPLSHGHAVHAALVGMLVNSVNADVMHFRFLWVLFALVAAPASRSLSQAPSR